MSMTHSLLSHSRYVLCCSKIGQKDINVPQPRVKLYVPKEGSFPIPFTYRGVVRRTNTTFGCIAESRIDDNWYVDGGRDLSGP